MDLSALESLLRTDTGSTNQSRRFADNSGERFAQLLGRADDKSRTTPSSYARRDDYSARPQRNDSNERPQRAERPEKPERAEKEDRAERTDKPHAGKPRDDKAAAGKVAKQKDNAASDKDDAAKKSDAADKTETVAATPADKPSDDAAAAKDGEAKISDADVANASTGVSPELVKMSALAAAHQIGLMMARVNGQAGAATADGTDNAAAGTVDADGKAAAKAQLELAAGAHPGAKPHATEGVEEDFADFVMRNAANPVAMAAAAANDDGDAKIDAKAADAKADAKGQMIVTISQPMAMAAPVAPVVALAVQASAQAQAGNGEIKLDTDAAASAALAGDDKAKPAAKQADGNPMFGQALDRAQNAQATQSTADAKPRAPIVPPHEQVAVHVRKAVDDGQNQITIRLNPTELGRIDVKIELNRDGSLRASFAAEHAQTLDALRNDSRQLERALQEAGLKPDAGGLNFSMRGDNRENAQAFADLGREQRGRANWGDDDSGAKPNAAPAPIQANYRAARRAAGGLDLAV